MAHGAKKYVPVVNVPSKGDLMSGLFDYSIGRPKTIPFTLESDRRAECLDLRVNRVRVEDGSGQSWIVWARHQPTDEQYKLYCSTQSRTGTVIEWAASGQPLAENPHDYLWRVVDGINVVNGPSESGLKRALFDRTSSNPRPITITLQPKFGRKQVVEIHLEEVGRHGERFDACWIVKAIDHSNRIAYEFTYSPHDRVGTVLRMC